MLKESGVSTSLSTETLLQEDLQKETRVYPLLFCFESFLISTSVFPIDTLTISSKGIGGFVLYLYKLNDSWFPLSMSFRRDSRLSIVYDLNELVYFS